MARNNIFSLDIVREKDLISCGFGAHAHDAEGNNTKLNDIMYECDTLRWMITTYASDASLRLVVK